MQTFQRGNGENNQDFMLIRLFNPNDLISCGGDINQSDSFRYAEGVCGGSTWMGYADGVHRGDTRRGMPRGYTEGICGGVCRGVCRGGTQRGMQRGM